MCSKAVPSEHFGLSLNLIKQSKGQWDLWELFNPTNQQKQQHNSVMNERKAGGTACCAQLLAPWCRQTGEEFSKHTLIFKWMSDWQENKGPWGPFLNTSFLNSRYSWTQRMLSCIRSPPAALSSMRPEQIRNPPAKASVKSSVAKQPLGGNLIVFGEAEIWNSAYYMQ